MQNLKKRYPGLIIPGWKLTPNADIARTYEADDTEYVFHFSLGDPDFREIFILIFIQIEAFCDFYAKF